MIQAFQKLYGINYLPTEQEWKNKFLEAGFYTFEIIHENSVENLLQAEANNNDAAEFSFSDDIDPSIDQIWDEHQLLTEKYASNLKYNVYRLEK